MSVVTERVESDETDPPFFLLISFLSFSLTTRISVAFIENSVQFIGQHSSALKVGHTCKRRENSGGDLKRAASSFARRSKRSPRWYAVLHS